MDFTLTTEQRAWHDRARDFAQGTIRPQATALDRAGASRTRSWRSWGDAASTA